MYSVRPYQAYSFRCGFFQQLRSSICCKRATSRSCFPSFIPFHSYFCSGGIAMLFSSTIISFHLRSCSFRCLSIWPECCAFWLKFFSSYQALHPFSTGVLPKVVLPCFLFANGVLSTSFISVVFFSWYGLTFARFFGITRLSKKQLSFTSSLFSSVFPPMPF